LKENPHLVYHPQRKKLSKILMKADQSNLAFDTAPSTPASNGRATPITFASPNPTKLNGCVNSGVIYTQVPAQSLTGAAPGTVILTPAVNLRTPAQNTSQRNQAQQQIQQNTAPQNLSTTMHQILELYYTSLCEPAFPEPGEQSTLSSPQYYLDQYQLLHHQAITNQQHQQSNQLLSAQSTG
uniref:CG1699 protein n=1 Tax=Gongylonema pulchrum TaxID=637853 RepID=A0A183DYG5_9BILA